VRIAAGENERTPDLVHRWLDAGAIDVLQTDALYVGGILRQLELAGLARSYGVRLAPHSWCSGPGLMANLVAAAAAPGGVFVELPQAPNPLRDRTLAAPMTLADGAVAVPGGPGLSVTLPEELETWAFDESAGPRLLRAVAGES
jgi:L-alanine-DL-glutamate epimerase-like enolase superfamily enzyme